jgi:hypothetical protein
MGWKIKEREREREKRKREKKLVYKRLYMIQSSNWK